MENLRVVEIGKVNFKVLKIEPFTKRDKVAVTIEFKKTGAQFTYVRKYYKGYVIVEGCYVYFNKKDYKPYEVREVYSTSGKRRTANSENGSLPKATTKKVVKVEKPKTEKPKEPKAEETKQVKHEKYDIIKCCLKNSIPVFLAGPAGSGKNYTVEQIAKELEWNFYFSNSVQQEYKLTGFIDAGGKYHDTEFYKACKEASEGKDVVFFLDEMDASIPEILVLLNASIANGYFEFPCGRLNFGEKVHFVSAGNTVGSGADELYTGRMVLDQATLDRFAIIEFDYSKNIELSISNNNTELIEFIHELRNEATFKGIRATFSYRCITMLTKLEKSGMNLKEAMKIAVVKGLDKDTINTFTMMGRSKYHKALREVKKGC